MFPSVPRVTVCIVTYNQNQFVGPCLESVLGQKTEFDFEVIVGDDGSMDGTAEILATIADNDPRVKLVLRPKNIGPTQNYIDVHNRARGEFVAHLDGDDLAASDKLSRQVSLLEANPNLAACGHRMDLIDEDGAPRGVSFPAHLSSTFGLDRLIRVGMPVFTSSIMYRRDRRTLVESSIELFDWYFLSDILEHGDAGYISESLGYYRVNYSSMVSSLGAAKMMDRMTELRLRRFENWPDRRAEFFANALVQAYVNVRQGAGVIPGIRRLLRESFTPRALWPIMDGFVWMARNRPAHDR